MTTLIARDASLFWQWATLIVLTASLLVILGAAIAFVQAILGASDDDDRSPRGVDSSVADPAVWPARRPHLDLRARTGRPVPAVRTVPVAKPRVAAHKEKSQ